jgi:hypothetical protein
MSRREERGSEEGEVQTGERKTRGELSIPGAVLPPLNMQAPP